MKCSKREIVRIYQGILATQETEDKFNQNFNYALSRNKRLLQPIVEAIQETEKGLLEGYFKETEELTKTYTKGKQVIKNGMVKIEDNKVQEFNEKKLSIVKTYEKEIKENDNFLKEEEEIKFFTIDNSNFPDMKGDLADSIFELRKEEKI